jgi:hypothetical protein
MPKCCGGWSKNCRRLKGGRGGGGDEEGDSYFFSIHMKTNETTLHSRAVNRIRAFDHNFVDGGGVINKRRCEVENCRQPRGHVEWTAADDCSEARGARLCTNQQQSGEYRVLQRLTMQALRSTGFSCFFVGKRLAWA